MADKTHFLVINPQANERKTQDKLDLILAEAKETLGDFQYGLTTCIGNGIDLAQQAKEEGYKTIVAVGGDGTLNEVLNVVVDTDIKLGLIPTGGSCDAFQTQGIPKKNIKRSFEILAEGHTEKHIVGYAKGDTTRYFIDMINGAFTGYVNSLERTWGKSWLKGDLRYTLLAFEAAFKFKPIKSKIRVDDQVRDVNLSTFILGFSDTVAGYEMLPGNHPRKGEIGVAFLRDLKGFGLISSMIRLMFSSITKNKKVGILYGKEISIETDESMTWITEGEIFSTKAKKIDIGIADCTANLIISDKWKYEYATKKERKQAINLIEKGC
ncbi:MAG: diacylglycerol/lipid kinase family protein [Candidatus Heimdallarchaeota archaeon]